MAQLRRMSPAQGRPPGARTHPGSPASTPALEKPLGRGGRAPPAARTGPAAGRGPPRAEGSRPAPRIHHRTGTVRPPDADRQAHQRTHGSAPAHVSCPGRGPAGTAPGRGVTGTVFRRPRIVPRATVGTSGAPLYGPSGPGKDRPAPAGEPAVAASGGPPVGNPRVRRRRQYAHAARGPRARRREGNGPSPTGGSGPVGSRADAAPAPGGVDRRRELPAT